MHRRRRRRTRGSAVVAFLLVIVCAFALAACTSTPTKPKASPEQVAAEKFLAALGARSAGRAAGLTTAEAEAEASITASLDGLGAGVTATGTVTGMKDRAKSTATAAYTLSWKLPGVTQRWTYDGSLSMVKQGSTWRVRWTPAAVHPSLLSGQHLLSARSQPARADLLDSAGQPLFTATPVVVVGIQPSKVTDLPGLAQQLASIFAISSADIVKDVTAAKPDAFVPVITIRQDLYSSIKAQIYDLPGTVFRTEQRVLPPATGWGEPLLGTVGPATKEIVDASGGKIRVGDQVGLSGLQKAYDERLRGTAGYDVYAAADTSNAPGQKLVSGIVPLPGKPVQLTLDRAAQTAAQTTLAGVTQAAAIVAVQPSTGKILAAANSASATSDIAVDGQFPAGSTFKIVTYGAAFGAAATTTPETQAACPGTVTVDGKEFENENAFDKGTVSLRDAFAYSCNTTAIDLALNLPADALPSFATKLGIGADWTLPVETFSGSVPVPSGKTEQAADAIGQGKVQVSPLSMAVLVGAAASGRPVAPSIEVGQQAAPGAAIDPTVGSELGVVMRAVVEQPFGTAHALAGLPGEVSGKTGTAEFGTDVPPQSHSWFVGVRGDLAISVFVYGGESSSTSAVPLAQQFLTAYP